MSKQRKRRTQPLPKKKCTSCGKEKTTTYFFKVDNPMMFPDGMINICRDCVRENVDVESIEQVIAFLRQIDKPFIESYWNEALQTNRHPLGEYIRKINSLQQVKNKTFDDSVGSGIGTVNDLISPKMPEKIETETGDVISYSDDLVSKWGQGYKKHEYLKLEKFYHDMMASYAVETHNHKQMLMQLAKLSVEMDNLLSQKDYTNYTKVSKAYDDLLKSAGFRPIDRKGGDEQRGLRSFAQIFEEVEKRSFVKPPPPQFDEDIVDAMILSLANYYHRLVGKEILTEVPPELKEGYKDYFNDEEEVDE